MKLKVALVQVNPLIGQVQLNISRISQLISNNITTPIDLIVLPELGLTGYNFSSSNAIKPYLESYENKQANNFSLNFAKSLSEKYNCFTVVGYPESSSSDIIYNSCALFNRQGELIHNYRKTFLYETDEVWGCSEGDKKGFKSIDVDFAAGTATPVSIWDRFRINEDKKSETSLRVNFGICMDLNPYKFEAPFNEFEFSSSCYEQRSNLMICPMAWLSPKSPSINKEISLSERVEIANQTKLDKGPDQSTVNYWILRMFPFLSHKYSYLPKWFNKVNVLCCNRVGVEGDIIFGGSSSILEFNNLGKNYESINQDNESVTILGSLSQADEEVLIKEIECL